MTLPERHHDQGDDGAERRADARGPSSLAQGRADTPADDGRHRARKDGLLNEVHPGQVAPPLALRNTQGMRGRWARNRRLRCDCAGHWFPHRVTSGACIYGPRRWYWSAIHQGTSPANAALEQLVHGPAGAPLDPSMPCPF